MGTTKKQHYVPRVYLKAWETSVTTDQEPNKQIQGVYRLDHDEKRGHGTPITAVLATKISRSVNLDKAFFNAS